MNGAILFRNAKVFDGWNEACPEGMDVLVEDGVIAEVSDRPLKSASAEVLDCAGRVLMPGMIDAHVHTSGATTDVHQGVNANPTYYAHYAARHLQNSLDHGFTTVRDVGGGDHGLASAIRDGLLAAPRFFYAGRMISQTGGHADFRRVSDHPAMMLCDCAKRADLFSCIVDGVDSVRAAVREELRRGAHHIKIMGSGGVASPSDPVNRCQYSEDEIATAVEEAERWGVYVASHCHPAAAVRRAVRLGVRTVEHGTLIDADTAAYVAEQGAFVVPTLCVMEAVLREKAWPQASLDKLQAIAGEAKGGLEIMKRAGVKMGFGTDLFGPFYPRRGLEFLARRDVLEPIDILRSATRVGAEIVMHAGRLGTIAPGAFADILVVDGDPTVDISVLAEEGRRLPVIMKAGAFHKRLI
jgi:imidazolonepropionase-like amidohydrolase